MFPGGIAGKLGNRFEAKWTVQKLIEVFLGEADSLRFESIDPADHGVEFSLSRGDIKEWHQTKRQGAKGNWTVGRLKREGVLTAALAKLSADEDQVFVFVSEEPAKWLQDLSGKASIAQSVQEFEANLSEDQRKELLALNNVWKTTSEQARLYLRRCRFEVLADTSLYSQIRLLAGLTFNEPVDTVFPLLRDYLEKNFNRELRTEDLRKELIESAHLTLRASLDPTLRECVIKATQRYLASYTPFRAGGETISRSQAKAVVELLVKQDGPNVVLLTGSAGTGKSGVIRQVIQQLAELGISHLAFRVDRYLSAQSAKDLGRKLVGRSEDPVVTLASLGHQERSVLIIDQVDAVSEASGRVGPMRDVVFELIQMAQASGYVRILAACRSFDLTNDQTLRSMEQDKKVSRIEITPLDWEHQVKPLLVARGVDTERLTPGQRTLLLLPINLSLFLEVMGADGNALRFSSTSDLYDLLIDRKQRAIRERGYTELSIARVIAALASAMSEAQLLEVPASVLDPYPNAVDLLASEHLIIRNRNRVAFFHESFFDYAFASFLAFLRAALTNVAQHDPERAQNYLQHIDPASHPAALYLHLETIGSNGEIFANILLSLLGKTEIFNAGPNGAHWLSFARAAKAVLPHIDKEQKAVIEDRILHHWPELGYAQKSAHDLVDGREHNGLANRRESIRYLKNNGFEQWCILKTIRPDCLSAKANVRLAMLERKFQGWTVPKPRYIEGGVVPPPIRAERAKFMTDVQWLKAIRTYKDARERRRKDGRWDYHAGARGLAQVLQERTKENPDRFVQLLFRFSADTAHDYPEGILFGLAESQTSPKTLLSAIQYAHSQPERPFGNGICRIFQRHLHLADDHQAFEILVWYVEHGNAATEGEAERERVKQEIIDIDSLTRRGGALQIRGAYGDRGAAAEALGAVIWECPSRLEEGIKVLERRVATEPLLSIRCCLTRPIYSVLRYDNRRAASLLRNLVIRPAGVDLTPLSTHYGVDALFYILHGSPDIGHELLDQLMRSEYEDQRLIGAFHLFREAFYNPGFAERADTFIAVSDKHRKLAANAAANHLPYADYRSRAETQLKCFFDDQVKEIRAEAADCFRNLQAENLNSYRLLLHSFIQSKAFDEENFAFFLFLEEARDQTFEEVVLSSERLVELIESGGKKDERFHTVHYLDDLIRREYSAVADQPNLRRRLLDVIDRMLMLDLYGTDRIIQEHERS